MLIPILNHNYLAGYEVNRHIDWTAQPVDNLQDPASGSGYITSVPHTLNNGDNIVWYSRIPTG